MSDPILFDARYLDLSARIVATTIVAASPAGAAETTIGSVAIPGGLTVTTGVLLLARASVTVGTAGVSAELRIRQTGTSGTVVADTGALTVTAADLYAPTVLGFDVAPSDGQLYVATLTIGSATAESAVASLLLAAIVV